MKIEKELLLQDIKDHVKIQVDLDGLVLKQLDRIVFPIIDKALEKLTAKIPTNIDDMLVAKYKDEIYDTLRQEIKELLEKVETKIEGKLS